ncbi:MAG: sigma 54-interacting transcriptional regulator [candidate division Zixibacteria bacterium]|nr:sigma 54-interacting transcriptional regulator [candidate division Zixibacteria bacterium]
MDSARLQRIAMTVSNERSLGVALDTIVQGLAEEDGVALARIWLKEPGDICNSCPMRKECPDQSMCLHLVASEGTSVANQSIRWNRTDGVYRRFPLGVRKVGRIGATGEPALLTCIEDSPQWLKDPAWALAEGITSFAGQPLLFRGEILGVIAIFSRIELNTFDLSSLRTFADNAAASIANARAFEEIARLKDLLEQENEYLRDEISSVSMQGEIVGNSAVLQKILRQVELVASTDTSVLIQGESGTGKELIARRIHELSPRKDNPLIRVNCASIPRELFESEFFGHVKGAFTGAIKDRVGRFELADKGTLFLDEVGEIPVELQSKLLRTLQEGTFERVGDEKSRQTDVRIIAATNRDLEKEITTGKFRQDLYFRLSVFPIVAPPLRSRKEDIPLLANRFLSLTCVRNGFPEMRFKKKHIKQLQEYGWPGNIRELQNVIERAVIISRGSSLKLELPKLSSTIETVQIDSSAHEGTAVLANNYSDLLNIEREMILEALDLVDGKISGKNGAAFLLGVPPSTLTSKMAKVGIKRKLRVESNS